MVKERIRKGSVYMQNIADIPGLKSGRAAMEAAGMQLELAAHLMAQSSSMGSTMVLRAGSPPVYNQKRGPKTGLNLTKTSTQGLFKGSLAADVRFTRLDDKTRKGKGHDKKDADHLLLPATDPHYQHTVVLPVTMQDILREVGEHGDLQVLGYEDGKLRLAYKEGKGDVSFAGQFIIDLNQGDSSPAFYSRPWDEPSHHPNWDNDLKVIRKPDALSMVPYEVYQQVFSNTFPVRYSDTVSSDLTTLSVKDAKVFANTPRTALDLFKAIEDSGVIQGARLEAIRVIAKKDTMSDVLKAMDSEEIKQVYDACALVTTGDWDGLALGHPPALLKDFPKEKMRVFNTFDDTNKIDEMSGLLEASVDLFHYLKNNPDIHNTPLGNLLNGISDPEVLFNEFSLARAGCITPYEFLYEQLINYSYRDVKNVAYGEQQGMAAVCAGMQAGLNIASLLKEAMTPVDILQRSLNAAKAVYREQLGSEMSRAQSLLLEEHLIKHLTIAIQKQDYNYVVPNIGYDQNVQNLFQHGFDARNPYGSNLEGAWLMITDAGGIIYGDTQEQLVEVLLTGDFLERNHFEVNFKADMSKGWGDVVGRQIELGQDISPKTEIAYQAWKTQPQSYQQWINEPDNNKANQLFGAMSAKLSERCVPGELVSVEAKEKQSLFRQVLQQARQLVSGKSIDESNRSEEVKHNTLQ